MKPLLTKVVNGTAEPVPVTGSISGLVSVANDPTVHAVQQGAWTVGQAGSWSVDVASLPAVQIDGTANTVGLDPSANTVQVQSSATAPLYVREVGGPAREPFQHQFSMVLSAGSLTSSQSITVPTGKWLVIEYASVKARMGTVNQKALAYLTTWDSDGVPARHNIPLTFIGEFPGTLPHTAVTRDVYMGSEPVSIYAPSDYNIYAAVERSIANMAASFLVTISGYLTATP